MSKGENKNKSENKSKSKKKTISEAEALVLLQQVTRETEQRMDGFKKNNRKVVTVIVTGVGICVLVAVLMLVMGNGQ